MAEKRSVAVEEHKGFSVQDLIVIAVLIAAGAVLKLTVSSFLTFAGMKPNFMIAMYCLAIILVRPKIGQAVIVGLLVGLVSQIPLLNATPLVNFASEAVGALVCGILVMAFSKIAPRNAICQNAVFPAAITFISTIASGYSFALIVGAGINGLPLVAVLITYAVMVLGTATMNAVAVAILAPVLKTILKKQPNAQDKQVSKLSSAQANSATATDSETDDLANENCPAIDLKDFAFCYHGTNRLVLHGINLTIPQGQFVGITGAAGCGKSSLTYALNGIVPHCYPGDFYGDARIFGHDTCSTSLTDLSRLVGSVCQDIESQMVSSIVEDEMLYGLENFGVPRDEIEPRITETLEAMGISDLRDRQIAGLSGGQKQKVAIASVLAMRPKILVLDEPTAELDPASSFNVFSLLRNYTAEHGITVIVIEQKIALLSQFADRLVIMEKGTIRFDGEPAKVLEHSEELLEIGVNCPRSTSLSAALRERGLYDGAVCKNVEEATQMMTEVLS